MSRVKGLVRYTLCLGCGVMLIGLVWQALSPRPDWHDAPIRILPLRFGAEVGGFGVDSIEHVFGGALLPPLFVLALGLPRTAGAARVTVGAVFTGSLLIELVQGFLPYRNFELTDIAANLAGSAVALYLLKRFRRAWPESVAISRGVTVTSDFDPPS